MVKFAVLSLLSLVASWGSLAHGQMSATPLAFQPGNAKQAAMLAKVPDARELVSEPFSLAFVDLDGDGKNEIIVRAESSANCGTGGCLTVVLQQHGSKMATLLSQNLFANLGVTDQRFGPYRALAALDDKGDVAIGEKPGTPLHGKHVVYPMLAQAPTPVAPVTSPAGGRAQADGMGPDIVGLRLGMPLAEVRNSLKAHVPHVTLKEVLTVVNDSPSTEYLSVLSATTAQRHPVGPEDTIGVDLSPPPSQRAIFIERFTGFPEGKQPLYAAVRAALIQKYGPPSHVQEGRDTYFVWALDHSGKRLSGKDVLRCGKYAPGDPSRRNFTVLFGGIKPMGCGLTVFAKLGQVQLRGGPGVNLTELAAYLSVSIVDDSGFEALREAAARAAADATRRKGAGVALPKM